jgi:hypothetical protein
MTRKKTVANSEKITPKKRTRKKAVTPTEEAVRQKAYDLWEGRGRPEGTPEIDWFAAQDYLAMAKAS